MWLVRLLTRYARPWARGRNRLSIGPSSTQARLTTSAPRSDRRSPPPALAIALASTLPTGQPADKVHHAAGLARRDAHVARLCPRFHQFLRLSAVNWI